MVYILTIARSGLQKLVEFVKFIENCGNIVIIYLTWRQSNIINNGKNFFVRSVRLTTRDWINISLNQHF